MNCPVCHGDHKVEVQNEKMVVPLGGKNIEIESDYVFCPVQNVKKSLPRVTNASDVELLFHLAIEAVDRLPDIYLEELMVRVKGRLNDGGI